MEDVHLEKTTIKVQAICTKEATRMVQTIQT